MDVDTASKDSRLLAYRMLWMVSELEAENKKERVTKTKLGLIMKIYTVCAPSLAALENKPYIGT